MRLALPMFVHPLGSARTVAPPLPPPSGAHPSVPPLPETASLSLSPLPTLTHVSLSLAQVVSFHPSTRRSEPLPRCRPRPRAVSPLSPLPCLPLLLPWLGMAPSLSLALARPWCPGPARRARPRPGAASPPGPRGGARSGARRAAPTSRPRLGAAPSLPLTPISARPALSRRVAPSSSAQPWCLSLPRPPPSPAGMAHGHGVARRGARCPLPQQVWLTASSCPPRRSPGAPAPGSAPPSPRSGASAWPWHTAPLPSSRRAAALARSPSAAQQPRLAHPCLWHAPRRGATGPRHGPAALLAARSVACAWLGPGAARSRRVSAALRALVLAWCARCLSAVRRDPSTTRSAR
jgi:hypothetical protein